MAKRERKEEGDKEKGEDAKRNGKGERDKEWEGSKRKGMGKEGSGKAAIIFNPKDRQRKSKKLREGRRRGRGEWKGSKMREGNSHLGIYLSAELFD